MTRTLVLAVLLAISAPALAEDPAPINFGLGGKLPEGGKFRIGRSTIYMTQPLAFSADGKTLAAITNPSFIGGIEAPIELWNVETGSHVATLRYHHTGVMAAAFSPDGSVLATSGIDNRVRFWDAKTGKDITKAEHIDLTGHGYNLCFSPDGKRLLIGSTKLEMYDVATQKPVKKDYFAETMNQQFFHTATWSPKGKYVAAACDGQGVRVWDADSGKFLYKLTDKYQPYRTRFAFSADDKLVLVSTWQDSLFKVFDAENGKEQNDVKVPANEPNSEQVQFAREMGRVAWVVQRTATPTIAVSDATGAELKRFDVAATVLHHLLSNDGKRIAVSGYDGSLRIYESETGKLQHTMLGPWSPLSRAAYVDGGKVLRTIHVNGTVHDFNADTGKHLKERKFPTVPGTHLIALTADGSLLATAFETGICTIWDLNKGEEKVRLKGTLYGYREPGFGPPGPFPLPPGPGPVPPAPARPAPDDGDCAPPPPVAPPPPGGPRRPPPFERQPGPPQFVAAFSADGKLFAAVTGKEDDAVTVWEVATGEEKHALKVAKGVGALSFSADGTHLFVGQTRSGVVAAEVPLPINPPPPGVKPDDKKPGEKKPEVGSIIVRRYELKSGKEVQAWKAEPGEKRQGQRYARTDVMALIPLPDKETLVVLESQVYNLWPPPPIPAGARVPEQRFTHVRIANLAGREKDKVIPGSNNTGVLSISSDGKAMGFLTNDASDPNKPLTLVNVVQLPSGKATAGTIASGHYMHFIDGRSQASVTFRPGSADLAVCTGDGTVLVVDAGKLKDAKPAKPGPKE